MKFYNINKLFIGKIGYEANTSSYNTECKEETIAIVEKCSRYYRDIYQDILSEREYTDFNSKFFKERQGCAIYDPESLAIYIAKKNKETQGVKILEHLAKKINKKKLITANEIKDLLFYLNTGKEKEDTKYNKKEKKINLAKNDYCTYLTNKKFKYEPTFYRENEINELFVSLYQNNKAIILVGPESIEKASIIEELAYKIQKKEVPDFLKKQKIIELDLLKLFLDNIDLNETILNIIIETIKNDEILFIDNIHTIYKNNEQIEFIFNQVINRQGLKLIGTTTPEEYNKCFNNNSNIIKLTIQEQINNDLKDIIVDLFSKYCKDFKIFYKDEINNIISILIELLQSTNIVDSNDFIKENSYDTNLIIEIINRIFIHAEMNNQTALNITNIMYAIKTCDKIDDEIKEKFINLYDEKDKTLKKTLL